MFEKRRQKKQPLTSFSRINCKYTGSDVRAGALPVIGADEVHICIEAIQSCPLKLTRVWSFGPQQESQTVFTPIPAR